MNFLNLIKFLRGYLTVCISGKDTSAFLNLLIRQKVSVWNATKRDNNLYINIFVRDYFSIPSLRRIFNGKVSVKVIKRHGIFKLKKRIVKRPGVLIGIFVFCAIIIFISQFIWKIDIIGNEKISKADIEAAYTALGVHIGIPKKRVDPYALRDKLPLLVREISWCSFNVEGNRLTINITELKENDKTNGSYSNIVAKTDGIITKIDLIAGNKQVSVGDVVSKGDLLVSGAPALNTQKFEDSKGIIEAKTSKIIKVSVPKIVKIKKKGDRVSQRSVLEIFNFKIPLYLDSVHYEYESKTKEKSLKLFSKPLPIKRIIREFNELIYETKTLSDDEIRNDATAKLLASLKKTGVITAKISEISKSDSPDTVDFVYKLTCTENICEKTEIKVSG